MYTEPVCYFDSHHPDTITLLSDYLSAQFGRFQSDTASPVFLCIGSDKISGDSLGPIVGSSLKERHKERISVYGTLEMPVHALNLERTLSVIQKKQGKHPLIAIDASLGRRDHLGYITAGIGSIAPGAGVNKTLCEVGDLFITGIVASFTPFSHLILQTTRLSEVILLADQITSAITLALHKQFTI